MTGFKKNILFIHRWLGFISGLVVFIVSITGCLFCFQDEIQDALYSYRHVKPWHVSYVAPSVIKANALKLYPGKTADYTYYYGKDRPAMVFVNIVPGKFRYVYLDPYSGQVLHQEDPEKNFFVIVENIHLYLLLPTQVGQLVVGSSVLIFVTLLITGIVLWWPKRKKDRKRSFTIKWNGRWRRINYDLHNVFGFYATSIALILAVTGLSIAFNWVREGVYAATNLGHQYASEKSFPASDTLSYGVKANLTAIDHAFTAALHQSPKAQMFLIGEDERKAGTISITAYAKSLNFGHSDYYYFDKYSGRQLKSVPYNQKSAGLKLNDLNYDIHVGQVGGLTGKIIAFITSLICASLPVTGFILWLGKCKKPKRKKLQHVIDRRVAKGMLS